MYACYVAFVTIYGAKKDGQKNGQREVTQKLRKGV